MRSFILCLLIYLNNKAVKSDYEVATMKSNASFIQNETFLGHILPTTTDTPLRQENSTQTLQKRTETQQIERTINAPTINATITLENQAGRTETGFKPSPQVEAYYEFNKFPVPPAFPETKHISSWSYATSAQPAPTTPTLWVPRVKFPEINVQTTKDHPYEFYHASKASIGVKNEQFDAKKTFLKPIMNKNHFDFQATVPGRNYGETGPTGDYLGPEKGHYGHQVGHGIDPWKKIIKFLTAFIPIGLLISALTPTVIQVSPVNGTQNRLRSEDGLINPLNKLLPPSFDYFNGKSLGCEDRVLCELLLSASESKNAEEHVRNLLDAFAKDGTASQRAEHIKKVFDAVKHRDCTPIICSKIQEHP